MCIIDMQERENAFFKHLKTGITIIHEMRKLLLCDLDTVLLYSKKLVKKLPPLSFMKTSNRGTENLLFNGNSKSLEYLLNK